jgi:type III secretion system FlhB-like substrate exporter
MKGTSVYSHAIGIYYEKDRKTTIQHYMNNESSSFQFKDAGVPCISVKGVGISADEIVSIARKYRVPVIERRSFAAALSQFPYDKPIPRRLLNAVCEILRYVGCLEKDNYYLDK